MELDYSAITNSPVYGSSKKIFEITGKQKSKIMNLYTAGVLGASLIIFLIAFLIPLLIPVIVIGVFAVIFTGLYKLIKKGNRQWKISQKALNDFASRNSFTYQEVPYIQISNKDLPDIELTLPYKAKLMSNTGYMKGTFHNLSFDYISAGIELIDYEGFSSQSGRQETRFISALYITLPISLPKLFIDSRRNNIAGFEAKANNIEELQKYDLESDFPVYYRVFAEKNDQINVLSILTPEVMQKLLDHKYYDVWIDGNKLVVFAQGSPFEYFAGIPRLFPTAEMLLQEIDKIARSLRH